MKFRFLTILGLTLLWLFIKEASAQSPQMMSQFRPPDIREPSRTEGGGTRGGSPFSPQQLPPTALIPEKGGVTVSEYPTFFVYIPVLEDLTDSTIEFLLEDDANNLVVYQTTILPPATAGIISITLPQKKGIRPLEIGKGYRWFVTVIGAEFSFVEQISEGTIQRIKPTSTLIQALKESKPEEYPTLYQQEGIWYETLSSLAELRRSYPDNSSFTEQWKTLLKSVGLENIADVPLLESLDANQSSNPPNSNTSEGGFRPTDNRLSPQIVPGPIMR